MDAPTHPCPIDESVEGQTQYLIPLLDALIFQEVGLMELEFQRHGRILISLT